MAIHAPVVHRGHAPSVAGFGAFLVTVVLLAVVAVLLGLAVQRAPTTTTTYPTAAWMSGHVQHKISDLEESVLPQPVYSTAAVTVWMAGHVTHKLADLAEIAAAIPTTGETASWMAGHVTHKLADLADIAASIPTTDEIASWMAGHVQHKLSELGMTVSGSGALDSVPAGPMSTTAYPGGFTATFNPLTMSGPMSKTAYPGGATATYDPLHLTTP